MGLAGVEGENGTFSVSCGLSGCESYPLTGIVSGGRTLSPADESGACFTMLVGEGTSSRNASSQ